MRKGREKRLEKEEVLQKKVKKLRKNIWPASLQPYSIVGLALLEPCQGFSWLLCL